MQSDDALASGRAGSRSTVRVVKCRVVGTHIGTNEEDDLAIEDPLEISISTQRGSRRVKRLLTTTMRTPGHDLDLIVGHLLTGGTVRSTADIEGIGFEPAQGDAAPVRATVRLSPGVRAPAGLTGGEAPVFSSCGVCGNGSMDRLALPQSLLIRDRSIFPRELFHVLPERMHDAQPTFVRTGGLHAAAIFSANGTIMAAREDIGRHNALDKAIGACLREGQVPLSGRILCVSGRMSYEILQKALVARIEVIAGIGAPSSLAVAIAEDFGVTLLGFVRNGSYNIYCNPERIL